MIYLDSCALMKLIREEDESTALQEWLDERADVEQVTSNLARTELVRVVRRCNHGADGAVLEEDALARELAEAQAVLDAVGMLELDSDVFDQAGTADPPTLKSLDAIHLAAARQLGDALTNFVTYDQGLRKAAEQAGLATAAPGPTTG